MNKRNVQVNTIIFLSLFLVMACTESEPEETPTTSSVDVSKEQVVEHTEQAKQESMATDVTSDESDAHIVEDEKIDLQALIHQTEQAREHAGNVGYEWNTTMPLIEEGHAAVKEGNHELAVTLFQEAKMQAELAIAQEKYAEENWQLLTPK